MFSGVKKRPVAFISFTIHFLCGHAFSPRKPCARGLHGRGTSRKKFRISFMENQKTLLDSCIPQIWFQQSSVFYI